MPFYEYRCTACQEALKSLQKISDSPLRDCPKCHQPALKKIVSAPSFRLKGGGWYETDFKDKNRRNLVDSTSEKKDTPAPEKIKKESTKAKAVAD